MFPFVFQQFFFGFTFTSFNQLNFTVINTVFIKQFKAPTISFLVVFVIRSIVVCVLTEPNAEFFSSASNVAFVISNMNNFVNFAIMIFVHIPIYPNISFLYNKIKENKYLY